MCTFTEFKNILSDYLEAARFLLLHPGQFFAQAPVLSDYKAQLLSAWPPVLVFAVGMASMHRPFWLGILDGLMAYIGIVVWAIAIKYTVVFFGERRSFHEALHVASCAALALALAWLPVVGLPAAYMLIGFWTYHGLTGYFKMNSGAALAAVALPVVVVGFGGVLLSFLFLWIASLTTIFNS